MRIIDIAALAAVVGPAFVNGKHLTPECLKLVYQRMEELNVHSWENGTRAEATLEWDHPELSVFGTTNSTNSFASASFNAESIPDIMEIANDAMDQRPAPKNTTQATTTTTAAPTETTTDGGDGNAQRRRKRQAATSSLPATTGSHTTTSSSSKATETCATTPAQKNPQLPPGSPLVPAAGAAGDPPSLGIPVLLANKATNGGTRNHSTYGDAAASQLNFLLYHVPRASNGAISHRECSVQLWADNVYMVPPFLAYYGVVTNNKTVVEEAYNQIKWYREILQDSSTKLWKHMSHSFEAKDDGLWATGNAWVVAGAARVIATIQGSSFASEMSSEINDLKTWAGEIFNASKDHITKDGLLRNYITNSSTFEDSSATALMASAGFRFSTMNITNEYVDMSLTMLAGASSNVNSTGYLNKVTDPMAFVSEGTYSPEGQSFIILAYAAYNDWDAAGKPGNTHDKSDPLSGNSAAPRVFSAAAPILAALAGSLAYVLA